MNILVQIQDFTGWDAVGLWQEARFDLKLRNQISRIAMVGEARRRMDRAIRQVKPRFVNQRKLLASRQKQAWTGFQISSPVSNNAFIALI